MGHRFEGDDGTGYKVTTVPVGEEPSTNAWQFSAGLPCETGLTLDGVPAEDMSAYQTVDDAMCLSSYVPATVRNENDQTGASETVQVGLVAATQRLEKSFVERMRHYTASEVNLFAGDRLSAGTLPACDRLTAQSIKGFAVRSDQEGRTLFIDDLDIGEENYTIAAFLLGDATRPVGAVGLFAEHGIARAPIPSR